MKQGLPPEVEIVGHERIRSPRTPTVDCYEVRILSERIGEQAVFIAGWLTLQKGARKVAPLLSIPGGKGTSTRETAIWVASTCDVCCLSVDWINRGASTHIPGLDPAPAKDAICFEGQSWKSSYQVHNVRAFLKAMEYLLTREEVAPDKLMVVGTSWGAFYTWLIAGLDPRIKHIFPTFGCGFLDWETRYIWEAAFEHMGPEKMEQWVAAFDPGRRVHEIQADVWFETATNDKYFSVPSVTETYRRAANKCNLLLVHNQDHFTRPYNNQAYRLIRHVLDPAHVPGPPRVGVPQLVTGRATLRVAVECEGACRVSFLVAAGDYTRSFSKRWRRREAQLVGEHWEAQLPIVDPRREIWFYAHADREGVALASSSEIQSVIPAEVGVDAANALFEPRYDIPDEPIWELPVGDRVHPALSVEQEDGFKSLAMSFSGTRLTKGVLYCLEGDVIAAAGYDALAADIQVARRADLDGLFLLLVTDFHARAEQCYGVRLSEVAEDFDSFRSVVIPFSRFQPMATRVEVFEQYVPKPFARERLCGVGLFYDNKPCRGEVRLARPGVTYAPANTSNEVSLA